MTESPADGFDLGLKMRDAAYRVLQVMTLQRQAKVAVWASAALSVAAVGLDALPPDLMVLKDLLNVGLISGLLKRVAESGEQMPDETIATEMEALLPLARLDELATGQKDLLRALTRQHTWQGQMLRLQEADQEAGARLLAGFAEMTGDLAEIRTLLAEAATVGQANEIIRLINDEVLPRLSEPAAYHGAGSPLPLFTPAPPPPPDVLPDPGPLPPGSFLPFDRNERFTGRESDLRELAALLLPITNDELRVTNEEEGGGKRSAPVVISTGIGGVGKTMLAVEFAWRYGRYFQGVHWVSAENPDAVDAAVAQCGMRMGLHPAFGGLTLAEQVALTERAWAGPEPWLIIFDNCEDEGLLAARRPKGGGARVLVTSRRERWESAAVRVRPLRVMSMPESVLLLRRHLTEGEGRPPRTNLSDSDLRKVAAELGDLPLALRLAGAFLRRYPHVDVTAYLADLRRPDLLEHRSLHAGPQSGRGGVTATFAVSFNRLQPDDPIDAAAVALLARAACFAPGEPLPVELLREPFADGAEPDDYLINDGLERLLELGLLEPAGRDVPPERLYYQLHRLIARFVEGELSRRDAEEGAEGAMAVARASVERAVKQALAQANGSRDPRSLRGAEIHLRHVADRTAGREDAETAVLNSWLGYYLDMSGDLAGAQPYYERALAIRERILDPEHPDLAASLNNLGALLDSMGDPAGARPYYERAHIIWERVFGPDNPNTAGSLNNMGTLLYSLGDLDGARPYYERALAIRERILGPEHPDTAQSLNNMGELLRDMGDLAGARPYLERALAIRERALGPEHPDTALILNNMGSLLQAMGALPVARPYFERALAIRERILGPEHPDTAQSLNNIGELLRDMGDLAGAQPYFERALTIFEAKLGPDHPDARNARDHLAAVS